MNIRYDRSVDAAYISLVEPAEAAGFSHTYVCDVDEVRGQIHLDFDVLGRLTGIEVLQASEKLAPSLLREAQQSP